MSSLFILTTRFILVKVDDTICLLTYDFSCSKQAIYTSDLLLLHWDILFLSETDFSITASATKEEF